jgi:DNA-binding LacI/PurR family transcriptional regulator
VLGGRPASPLRGGSSVDSDNRQGAQLAAEHLVELGRRRLAVLAGPSDMTAAVDRLEAFRADVRAAGLEPPTVAYGDFTQQSGAVAMRQVLARRPETDAVFAGNDLMALGALRVLREAGRQVPGDVAVIGFDDIHLSRYCDPPLSTLHQPIAEQARLMVAMILDRIEGKPVQESVVLPVHLVRRASTGGDGG